MKLEWIQVKNWLGMAVGALLIWAIVWSSQTFVRTEQEKNLVIIGMAGLITITGLVTAFLRSQRDTTVGDKQWRRGSFRDHVPLGEQMVFNLLVVTMIALVIVGRSNLLEVWQWFLGHLGHLPYG